MVDSCGAECCCPPGAVLGVEEIFNHFLEHSPIYVFFKDEHIRSLYLTRNYETMLGRPLDALLGKRMDELFPSPLAEAMVADDKRVLAEGKPVTVDEEFNGRYYRTIKFPICMDGRPRYLAGYTIDITEQTLAAAREQELHEMLERSTRMESLGVLAGGVAHDLNNVLGPILVLPDLVADYLKRCGDPADPEYQDAMDSIETVKICARRAVGVVKDLVVMSRRGSFEPTLVDVREVVRQFMESPLVSQVPLLLPGVQIACDLGDEPLWCTGSDSRILRILSNLFNNATEAMRTKGGCVTVSAGRRTLKEDLAAFESVPAGNYIVLRVSDTGHGIDASVQEHIFEPFFSTRPSGERSGSGLGLSVVHGLVKDHRGYIDVASVPGKGAVFTVYLPAVEAPQSLPGGAERPQPQGAGQRVLVVDDEHAQQVLARLQLGKLGYSVQTVSGGEEAVRLMESAAARGGPSPFDLVIVDMVMKGMDGLATTRALRAAFPAQKILITSGFAPEPYEKEVQTLGLRWLSKPYTGPVLAEAVQACLNDPDV